MKKFSEFLSEAFTKPYGILWVAKRGMRWACHFTTKDDREGSIEFTKKVNHSLVAPDTWDLAFEVGFSVNKTSAGDQYQIFATVIKAVKEFMDHHPGVTLKFSAFKDGTDSRASLYRRMVQKMLPSDYTFSMNKVDIYETEFVLKKKNA